MTKFERVLSDAELISATFKAEVEGTMGELRAVEQAVLAKLAKQEPVAEIDCFGDTCCHVFGDRLQLKRGTKLYAHPSPPVKQEPIGYLHANELSYIDAKSGTKEELYAYDYTIPLYAAPVPQKHTEQPLEMVPEGFQIVPKEPTEEMHHAARDWSVEKCGKAIGSEASHGCYQAMLAAAPKHKGSNDD